jgi:hypothetical protein
MGAEGVGHHVAPGTAHLEEAKVVVTQRELLRCPGDCIQHGRIRESKYQASTRASERRLTDPGREAAENAATGDPDKADPDEAAELRRTSPVGLRQCRIHSGHQS